MACRLKIFSNVPAERKLGNVRQALRPQCFHHGGVVVQIQAQIVFDCHDLLRAVVEHHQKTRVGRVCAPQLAARDVPRVAHHQLEIIVVVHGSRNIRVILDEFSLLDDSVPLDGVKVRQKFHQALFWMQSPREDVWMVIHAEAVLNVLDRDPAAALRVQDFVSHVDHRPAPFVYRPSDRYQEFVVSYWSAVADHLDQLLDFVPAHRETVIPQTCFQFVLVQQPVPVVIHDPEAEP
mmetsp:Transcript_105072/g.295909  ORF Transcript_105072/g.295909 Transcript_105072/m.295909 type:complete len:235 (+) Transcript_105072:29-733(+)